MIAAIPGTTGFETVLIVWAALFFGPPLMLLTVAFLTHLLDVLDERWSDKGEGE